MAVVHLLPDTARGVTFIGDTYVDYGEAPFTPDVVAGRTRVAVLAGAPLDLDLDPAAGRTDVTADLTLKGQLVPDVVAGTTKVHIAGERDLLPDTARGGTQVYVVVISTGPYDMVPDPVAGATRVGILTRPDLSDNLPISLAMNLRAMLETVDLGIDLDLVPDEEVDVPPPPPDLAVLTGRVPVLRGSVAAKGSGILTGRVPVLRGGVTVTQRDPGILTGRVPVLRGAIASGSSFTIGTTMPDATNTGLAVTGLTNSALTVHNGDWTITTAGTVIDGYLIRGLVDIRADNVTIRNSKVVSHTITAYTFGALIRSNGNNVLIENCELTQYDDTTGTDNSVYYIVGVEIDGGTATLRRINAHDCNDLVYITGGTHTVQANYLHDPSFRTDDADQASNPTHPNWSHNDGIQCRAGSNHLFDANTIEMRFSTRTGMNSTANPSPTAEQVWPNCHGILMEPAIGGSQSGTQIKRNWFRYGATPIHFTQNTYGGNSATVTGNRFTPNQSQEFGVYTQIRIDPTTIWTVTESADVYSTDTDTPTAFRGQPLKAPTTSGTTKVWQFNPSAHTP